MDLGQLIIASIYFFLPAYFANMAPEIFKKIPFLGRPLWEKRLGKHKTWRGLILGTLTGILIFTLQKYLFQFKFFQQISLINYSDFSLILGFLLGFGALFGDAFESFFKRRNNLKPGEAWIPWDQLDFFIGAIVLSWFVYVPPIEVVVTLTIFSFLLHIIISRLGYWLGIKKNKW